MNLDGISKFNQARIEWAIRLKYSPMPELDMETLASQLNAARIGDLRQIGKTWEVMFERDGELAVNSDKRKSDASGLEWQIVSDGSLDGDRHAAALQYFYDNLTATQALEQDDTGGVDHLIYQVMSAVDNKYSVHEMLLRVDNAAQREVTAEFRHTPIWFMECRRGYLGYLQHIFDLYGAPCIQGEWLTAVNIGWMRPLSMAYAMKMFPLRDWLLFCTRYGSGFLDATTDATIDSPEWQAAQNALNTLANDGAVLHNKGVEFKFLEQSARNSLPFHPIVEMINGLYAKCYRGVDLATSSRSAGQSSGGQSHGGAASPVGASVQKEESGIFLLKDARWATGVFNERVDRPIIRYLFGQEPRAWFVLMPPLDDTSDKDLAALQGLVPMGFKVMLKEVYKRFRWSVPEAGEPCLTPAAPAAPQKSEVRSQEPEKTPAKPGDEQPPQNPKSEIANPKSEKPQAVDATGEETDPLLKGEQQEKPTQEAREEIDTPIAPGAQPARWQTASTAMPDTQVDAAGFWSRTGLMPKGADGKNLPQPSLGYALPNSRFEILNSLGLGNSRAAQALRREIFSRKDARAQSVALQNSAETDLQKELLEKVQAAVLKSFLEGLSGKHAIANGDLPGHEFHGNQWTGGIGITEGHIKLRGAHVTRETEKAALVKVRLKEGSKEIWFPKSQISMSEQGEVHASKWIIDSKHEEFDKGDNPDLHGEEIQTGDAPREKTAEEKARDEEARKQWEAERARKDAVNQAARARRAAAKEAAKSPEQKAAEQKAITDRQTAADNEYLRQRAALKANFEHPGKENAEKRAARTAELLNSPDWVKYQMANRR